MSCLPDISATLEQHSSTCKDFSNCLLFAFLLYTLYISNFQIDEANSSLSQLSHVCMLSPQSISTHQIKTCFSGSDFHLLS